MARKTLDPSHTELTSVLEGLLARNEDVTARAVTRLHTSIRDASGITRHTERRQLLEQYQARQRELRKVLGQVQKSGTAIAADKLQQALERVRELEANEAARVASHLAMIHVVAELGGTAKLQRFYKRYADIRDRLAREGSIPATFLNDDQ
ncbi:hypothetical protein [Hydrogenophaga sp. NFH-34]|uniref:hypothetical protein n=1 Tax=Hydrogenophaga sp. NFH-34 TaxID=2744446 RepID=UPI001F19C132|nr:hypothetical protein [Hydrogenophaga sp. NFH-34]